MNRPTKALLWTAGFTAVIVTSSALLPPTTTEPTQPLEEPAAAAEPTPTQQNTAPDGARGAAAAQWASQNVLYNGRSLDELTRDEITTLCTWISDPSNAAAAAHGYTTYSISIGRDPNLYPTTQDITAWTSFVCN